MAQALGLDLRRDRRRGVSLVGFRGSRFQLQIPEMRLPTPQYTDYSGMGEGFVRGFSSGMASSMKRKQALEDEKMKRQQALEDEKMKRQQGIEDEQRIYDLGLQRKKTIEEQEREGFEMAAYPKMTATTDSDATATYREGGSGFQEGLPISFLKTVAEERIKPKKVFQPVRPLVTSDIIHEGKPSIRTIFPGGETTYEQQYNEPQVEGGGRIRAGTEKERTRDLVIEYLKNRKSGQPITTEQQLAYNQEIKWRMESKASVQSSRHKGITGKRAAGKTEEELYNVAVQSLNKDFGIGQSLPPNGGMGKDWKDAFFEEEIRTRPK